MTSKSPEPRPRKGRGQPVRDVSPERAAKILARADELEKAEAAYRAELMAALDEDRASIRSVAAVAGRSPVTIQTWWTKYREDRA